MGLTVKTVMNKIYSGGIVMKKLASILLSLCLTLSLAACSGGSTASTASPAPAGSGTGAGSTAAPSLQGKTITFTMQKYGTDPAVQDKVLKEITAKFKEETGCTVNYSIIDWGQALTKLTLACTGGEAPDVADVFFTHSMVQMGQGKYGPMEISDVMNDLGGESAFFAPAIEEVKVNNGIYGIPWRMDTRIMVYNTDDFKAAGIEKPPVTYDELIADAKKLTKTNGSGDITHSGMVWNIGQSRFDQSWFTLVAGFGGRVMNESYTKMDFNNEAGAGALKLMLDTVKTDKVCTPNVIDPSFDSSAEFMAGKTSMVLGVAPDFKTTVEAQAPQLKGKFAAAPMPNKTGDGVSSIAFAAPICVMQTTKEPEAAKAWVKFFCSTENQVKFCTALNYINSSKAVMNDPAYSNDPWLSVCRDQTTRAIQGDGQNPLWSQIDAFPNGPLNTMCTNVIAGQDIQKSMDEAEVQCAKILSSGR
jgi:ABC-type sugar transport system, periplasmic component